MAIIWMDGPDHYGTNRNLLMQGVYATVDALSLRANSGPGGVGTVFDMGGATPPLLRKVLPGNRSVVGMGARFYITSFFGGTLYQFIDQFGVNLGTLEMLQTGALRFVGGGGIGLLWQSDPVIVPLSWQHIECVVGLADDNTGFLRVGVDSITIYDNNALQTQPITVPAQNICAQVQWRYYGCYMRDLYIWDNTGDLNNSGMQGDRQVITTYPTADTAKDDWVPSAGGTGWPLVSNVPPNDGVFIAANAPDLTSEFQMGDIDTDITSISAAMVVSRLWKSDAGLATVHLQMSSGGDTVQGVEKPISTDKVFYASIFEKDPHTGNKWTPGGINNATVGLERAE